MAVVLIPLPDRDFDVTEAAVPWSALTRAGHQVVFATESGGQAPAADPRLLSGVLFGKLGAEAAPKALYSEMIETSAFRSPVSWSALEVSRFDGLLLPGGHAPGMKQYLESEVLQRQVAEFWALQRPVAAICHGVLVLARTRGADQRSVLWERRTTCLPAYMERLAYYVSAWKLGKYYRTYPEYVEEEVRGALRDSASQFQRGPITIGRRGTEFDDSPAYVVEDGNYLSSRWPGDAYLFGRRFVSMLSP